MGKKVYPSHVFLLSFSLGEVHRNCGVAALQIWVERWICATQGWTVAAMAMSCSSLPLHERDCCEACSYWQPSPAIPLGSLAACMLRPYPLCIASSHWLTMMGLLGLNHSWPVQGSANRQSLPLGTLLAWLRLLPSCTAVHNSFCSVLTPLRGVRCLWTDLKTLLTYYINYQWSFLFPFMDFMLWKLFSVETFI